METRDAGFNIMLATDSYKVAYPPRFRGLGWREGRGHLLERAWWIEVGKSQGGFITSPKANTVQLRSVTGSRRAEGGAARKDEGGGTWWRRLRAKL